VQWFTSLPIPTTKSFNIFAEQTRSKVEGQMLIVRQAHALAYEEWASWVKLFVQLCATFQLLTLLIGPITSLILLWIVLHFHQEIYLHVNKEYKLSRTDLINVWSSIGIWALFTSICITFFWPKGLKIFLSTFFGGGILLFSLHSSALKFMGLPKDWTVPTLSRPICIAFDTEVGCTHTFSPMGSTHSCMPCMHITHAFTPQAEIMELIGVRRRLLEFESFRFRIQNVAVGSFWVETVCSVLLYHEIYNNPKARYIGRICFTYILPIITTIEVFSTLMPKLAHYVGLLVDSVTADYGIVAGRIFWNTATAFVSLPRFAFTDRLFAYIGTVTSVFGEWAAYISSWIAPFDEALTYIRAKFVPIQVLLGPVFSLLYRLGDVVRALFVSLAMPLQAALRVS
jgi:hypothetical protein